MSLDLELVEHDFTKKEVKYVYNYGGLWWEMYYDGTEKAVAVDEGYIPGKCCGITD